MPYLRKTQWIMQLLIRWRSSLYQLKRLSLGNNFFSKDTCARKLPKSLFFLHTKELRTQKLRIIQQEQQQKIRICKNSFTLHVTVYSFCIAHRLNNIFKLLYIRNSKYQGLCVGCIICTSNCISNTSCCNINCLFITWKSPMISVCARNSWTIGLGKEDSF